MAIPVAEIASGPATLLPASVLIAAASPAQDTLLPGPVAVLLLALSIAVLTVSLDRGRWWLLWWRRRASRRQRWQEQLAALNPSLPLELEDLNLSMAQGEPLLQSAAVLAPLLGLLGTVLGLMQVLGQLGPDLLLPAGNSLQGYGQVLLSAALGLLISLVATASLQLNQALRQGQIERLHRSLRRSQAEATAPAPERPREAPEP
jgi:biopolymer transport protein ExbB